MLDFFSKLFDTSDFPERWHCGNWTTGHGWLHILSDLGVWSAYLAIPMVLVYFAWRREDLPFRRIFWLFGAFILACGSTHLMEAIIFYWPAYRLAGVIKFFTAAVSWATVLALIPIVPLALAMRSPEELEREILERRKAEESLRLLSAELEVRVEQRTEELKDANRLLQAEIVERQRAEETLRQQREWFRVTLSSIGDAVIATDAEGRVTFLNPGAEELTGWRQAEATGEPIDAVFRIIDEHSRSPAESPVAKVLRNRSASGLANHTLLVDRVGAARPIDDSAAPILDDQGHVLGVVMVFQDVTGRRQAEQQLRFQADMLDKVGQSIVATDKTGAITYWNRYAENMYGWSSDEVIGRNLLDVAAAPQSKGQAGEIMSKVLEGEPWTGELLLTRRDGRTVPALVSDTPLRNHAGEIIGVVGISMDITEQRRSQEALLASERRFRFLAETIPQFVYTARPDGSIDYFNQLWYDYTGLRFEDDWRSAIHPADRERTERQWATAMRTGITFEIEHRLRGSDDSCRWFLGRARPMRDEQGRIVKWFGSYTDIDDFKQSQEALRESQDRLRLAQHAAGAGVWDWDATSGAVHWSEECFRLHGISSKASWTREQWLSVVATEDRDHVDRETRWAIDTRSDLNVEYRIDGAQGEQRWLVSIGKIVRPADRPELLSGITLDVTDRKRAEEAIRRAEGQFRRAIIDAPNPIMMSAEDGEVLQLSRAWTTLTGYSRTDIRTVDDWWRLARCAEAGGNGTSIQTLFDPERGVQERELTIQTREGETRIWNFTVSCPGQLHDGRKFFVGMANDITERTTNERAFRFLADASSELATLIDDQSTMQKVSSLAVPFLADWCAIDVVEPDGELRRIAVAPSAPELVTQSRGWGRKDLPDSATPVGPLRVIGTGESEMADELSDDVLKQLAGDEERLQWVRSLDLRSYLCVPINVLHKTFGAITLAVTGSRRRYSTADLRLAEELARRTSVAIENSRLYQEVRQADQHKNEFLAMLAHELRNPLAPIRNSLGILGNNDAGAETVARAREVMERQLSHLIRLVDDLLDVSRIMRGRIELRIEPLQIATVVARAVEIAHPAIDAQGHQLTVSIPERPIWVNGDLVRLGQVVANLLHNAAKYTGQQGRIAVTAAFENDELTLHVTDNGIGIAADMLPRVFELFTQADRSISRSQGGLGIGLTLVRKLVEMHGGSVEAHSAGVGQGSEFVVRLPARVDETNELLLPAGSSGLPSDAPLPRRRVLVVDDNIDAAESLGVLLELEGSDVRLAHNGATALAIAEEFLPEIVLLDIGMPGMDGYEVARKLPGRMPTEHSLIVAVTGWGQDEDRRRSREAGFDDHFVKPVDPIAIHELMSHPKLTQSSTS